MSARRSTVALVLAGLAGCQGVWDAETIGAAGDGAGDPFKAQLAREYADLAASERRAQDWPDVARYVRLGSEAARGEPVPIPALEERDLDPEAVPVLAAARGRLETLFAEGGLERAPADSARAQGALECWLEQQEEGRQPDDIAACAQRFETAIAAAEDQLLKGDLFVLLPQDDGSLGRIEVTSAGVTAALTDPRATVELRQPGTLRETVASSAEVDRFFGSALVAQPRLPRRFTLYFEPGTTDLTAASQAQLPDVIAEALGRATVDVAVVGHTDTVGASGVNARLARQRARLVADRLIEAGIASEVIEVTSSGEAEPVVPTPDNTDEPRNRRTEVTVR